MLRSPELYFNIPYLLCSMLNPLVTAATACLVFRLSRQVGLSREWSVVAALTYALASPAAPYARFDFAQPLAALTLTAGVWALLRSEATSRPGPLIWAGASLGYGVLARAEFLALIPWILGWVYARSRDVGRRAAVRRAAIVASPVCLAALVHLLINWLKFGNAMQFRERSFLSLFPASLRGFMEGLVGELASPGRGLIVFFPLTLLALPGLLAVALTRSGAGSLAGGFIGITLPLYASFYVWWGGWSWGPRFLVPLLPLLTLAATAWTCEAQGPSRRRHKAAFFALGVIGFVCSWNGILYDFVPYYVWIHRSLGLPEAGSTFFQPVASPLVSGWVSRRGQPIDIFWIRLATHGELPGLLRSVAPAAVLLLLASLVYAGHMIRKALRSARSAPAARVCPGAASQRDS